MGLLEQGKWVDTWYETKSNKGEFTREPTQIRNWITKDGSPGPSGQGGFVAESGRYHLYVSLACPWAHRTIIFRKIKNLDNHISLSIVSPNMMENGWTFNIDEGSTGDPIHHFDYLYQIYTHHDKKYSGRVTVPVLYDKKNKVIVSNESSEIIRMFNEAFNAITHNTDDYYPTILRKSIDSINAFVYENINNGVYRCGFATTQSAYEQAYQQLFQALDTVEDLLTDRLFLTGDTITEADWRLFTTLIRFDSVYFSHFKCNKQQIENYTHLSEYLRQLYLWPGISETVNFEHIKRHYYFSHRMINPTQIIPVGPEIDYTRPYHRRRGDD